MSGRGKQSPECSTHRPDLLLRYLLQVPVPPSSEGEGGKWHLAKFLQQTRGSVWEEGGEGYWTARCSSHCS